MSSEQVAPVTEARPSSPPPALKDCVSVITAQGEKAYSNGELVLSMLGFCYHIARDQATISKLKPESNLQLQISEIPAIRELLSNSALFNTMVSMLNPPTASQGGTTSQQHMTIGRKRAPSEDLTHSRKRQLLSPVPNRYSSEEKTQLPVESTSVLAATCLYTALQHFDHWPIQIVRAFAADCFGSRIWVDDDRCSSIVANLGTSINSHHDDTTLNETIVSAAEEAQKYFSSLGNSSSTQYTKSTVASAPVQSKQPSSKETRKLTAGSKMDVDTSSSSGEEEVLESEILPSFSMTTAQGQSLQANDSSLQSLFSASSPSFEKVRSRYVSSNVELMYEVISDTFEERLNSKSKQNSRLLQTLPLFLRIPRVRVLVSRHLERWLQSPALAGLARTLFAEIVKHVEKIDPPLYDDLEVVDNILKLKLKANQLGIFVEHITAIVKMLPSVAKQVFTYCISQGDSPNESAKDKLHVLRAVYVTMDQQEAAAVLASSIIALESEVIDQGSTQDQNIIQYKDFHSHLCKVVATLNTSFDGFQFVTSIVKEKIGTATKQTDALNSSRLIFMCATLVTCNISSLQPHAGAVNTGELSQFRGKMLRLRKTIMQWCINDLCSSFQRKIVLEEERKCADSQFERGAVVCGPGVADFASALDPESHRNNSDQQSSFNVLMSIMRCLMFITQPTSTDMVVLLGEDSVDGDHCNRVELCCKYGADVDDELIQMVLNSQSITPITAISIIENLIERCNVASTARIVDCSSETLMGLYKLAEFKPVLRNKEANAFESTDECTSDEDEGQESQVSGNIDLSSLPRLAVTSLWWRISCIALVISGLSPKDVGATLWFQHPTLRSLIIMTTSQKYRFPTADCNENERDKVKQTEARTRETEANIVEKLFMPPKPRRKKQTKAKSPKRTGMRFSARQREKQEKIRRIEEERNAAALHAEHLKLKKVLRSMQKNIMLFDPEQPQRKPPKGFVDLLLSANKHFGLAEKFRAVTAPDFLLQTIGEGRSAIERAYDWLIPIISSDEEIIHRLQPNAACYLLLRAYGSIEGEKNKELLVLTKPLLSHVKGCLTGDHGERNAMLAMELLMSDIADEHAMRRVCARRVLQDAFGGETDTLWLCRIIDDKHSEVFIPMVRRAVSRACAYERGSVLSTYVLALSKYREFMQADDFNFVSSLCELIDHRPHVFAEALGRFPELRRLCIAEVKQAIDDAIANNSCAAPNDPTAVTIVVNSSEYVLSSNLLGATLTLMSNWQEGETTDESEKDSINALLKLLVTGEKDSVLSTAMRNGKRAVSVEEWVLLATSKSAVVAKQAALSVPDIFLPRLLLCCGMSRMSFVAMLERLSKLGAAMSDPAKLYDELLSTSAIKEWGLQQGHRLTIKKRLHGRITSYLRIFSASMTNQERDELNVIAKSAFVTWLASEVSISTAKKSESDGIMKNLNSYASSTLDDDSFVDLEEDEAMDLGVDEEVLQIYTAESKSNGRPLDLSEESIKYHVAAGEFNLLDELLECSRNDAFLHKDKADTSAIVSALINSFMASNCDSSLGRIVQKFVPQLSKLCCNDMLWRTLFIGMAEKSIEEQYLLSLVSGCIMHWPEEGIAACQNWITERRNDIQNALSMKLVLRFLVVSSGKASMHCILSNENYEEANFVCVESEENTRSVMNTVLLYLDTAGTNMRSGERNSLPDWLVLTCIMTKSHHPLVFKMIMETIESNPSLSTTLYSVLLRLYLMFPTFSFSDSKMKSYLIKAAQLHIDTSRQWRCPLDSQAIEMLRNVGTSPHTRLFESATDFAKTHGLIFIRHLRVLHERLEADGLGQDCSRAGRVGSRPPTAMAQLGDRLVKVSVSRWGFSYNESIWSTVLDLMMSLPPELLFTCGIKTGLHLVLDDYLKLFYGHVMELGSEECISQLRPKYLTLVQSFRASNSVEFQKWSQTDIIGFGKVQTLLLSKVGTFS